MNKFESILNNAINGNTSEFRHQIKKLRKLELIEFIEYAQGQNQPRHYIINKIRLALEI